MQWNFEECEECESTFIPARQLPAWSAINAKRQLMGRGRFNRRWFGEEGGLWICYNVPIDEKLSIPWGQLPLVAGLALMRALSAYNLPDLRLRWPNDILLGRSKLAGILVERPAPHMASIGIGVNMHNNTESLRGKTQDPPTRLADWLKPCPSIQEFREKLAQSIFSSYCDFLAGGMPYLCRELQQHWGAERPVAVITDEARHCGIFKGINAEGSPIIQQKHKAELAIPAISVTRLKEIL